MISPLNLLGAHCEDAVALQLEYVDIPAGQVLSGAYPIADLSQVQLLFGTRPAKVLWAGMTFAGVFQINVQVPDGIAAGDAPVVLKIGSQSSMQATVLPFQ